MEKQKSEEWFKKRTTKITGSSIGSILNLSPWSNDDDVLRKMVREYHNYPSEFEGNIATEYGVKNEKNAILTYQKLTGNLVKECGFFAKNDWLGATPDGLIGDDGLIEVKCPFGLRNELFPEFKSIEKQPHYYAQLQIEMYCSDRLFVDFCQWNQFELKIERVKLNQEYIESILPILKEFHNKYLKEREFPNAKKHLEEKIKEINTKETKKLIKEYEDLILRIDILLKRKEEIIAELVKVSCEKDAVFFGKKLTKVTREGSISYSKALKELLPDADLSTYKGMPTTYWRLS